MFCSKCGNECVEGAAVCPKCGCALQGAQIVAPKICNNLILAIISMICCCIPTGIVAIIYSLKVDSYVLSGQIEEAKAAANSAQTWAVVGIVLGLISSVLYFIFGFAEAFAEGFAEGFSGGM